MLKTGEFIDLDIERMSFGPAAIGRYQTAEHERPIVIFVEGAAPGDKIKARLLKNHKSYWEAELVEVLKPSSVRTAPPCSIYEKCGGCQWQHLEYPAQVQAKKEILIHQLHRTARIEMAVIENKLQVHAAKNPLGYRSRIQAHGDRNGLGFFARGSHQIVHTDRCIVANPKLQEAWTEFLTHRPLAELSKATGQFKVEWTLTESGQTQEAINRKHGALGFTQVNQEQNDILKKIVKTHAAYPEKKTLLFDLYGGNGNLSLDLLENYQNIFCVDSHNNGQDPVSFAPSGAAEKSDFHLIRESTEDFIANQRWRDWGFTSIDCMILDPPRTGLRETAKKIAKVAADKIIFVSCDPATLARDITDFLETYSIEAIHLIDMFPQTFHLETVMVLNRK